nr:nucleotidyltransferase family protein [Planosporangium flavigriseum]
MTEIAWAPPGVDLPTWRRALAEDVVDLLSTLAAAEPAIAVVRADRDLAAAVAWPGMPVYELERATPGNALRAAAADGYDMAAVLAADAPDLPGMLIGKLLQPLTSRIAAVAPAHGGGLVGVASRLPLPKWLPEVDLDAAEPEEVRAAAPRRAVVAVTPGWHRLRGADDLARLDPALEGWENTRMLLTTGNLGHLDRL